jgi:hypothetical protein
MKDGNFFTELNRRNVYKVAVARPGISEQITPCGATPTVFAPLSPDPKEAELKGSSEAETKSDLLANIRDIRLNCRPIH